MKADHDMRLAFYIYSCHDFLGVNHIKFVHSERVLKIFA